VRHIWYLFTIQIASPYTSLNSLDKSITRQNRGSSIRNYHIYWHSIWWDRARFLTVLKLPICLFSIPAFPTVTTYWHFPYMRFLTSSLLLKVSVSVLSTYVNLVVFSILAISTQAFLVYRLFPQGCDTLPVKTGARFLHPSWRPLGQLMYRWTHQRKNFSYDGCLYRQCIAVADNRQRHQETCWLFNYTLTHWLYWNSNILIERGAKPKFLTV
jgi:hypothetical protein